jgi:hypothetical protein
MKRLPTFTVVVGIAALGLTTLAVGCGGSGSTSASPAAPSAPAPSAPAANTASTTFNVTLLPVNENPPITNADASSAGSGIVTLTVTKDGAGNVTAATASFQMAGTGFPAGTTINMAHIHAGGPGVNGSIVVNTGLASGDMVVAGGNGNATKNNINVASDLATAILKDPASYYLNIHTLLNPNGAIRGQLAAGASGGTPSPAPAPGDPGY